MSFPQRIDAANPAWLLTDGHAGNLRQAEALAMALGVVVRAPTLAPTAPWRWLAPRRLPAWRHAFGPAFAEELATTSPPALAIGCGRQGALATRLLRERGARVVQILDPRIDPRHWDLVIAPEHDSLRGANVLPVLGSLNPVDAHWLAEAAARYPALAQFPAPRIALLVGGPTRHAPWTATTLQALLADLRRHLSEHGGSLLATVSRRTPGAVLAGLRDALRDLPGLLWDGSGANPYPGLLAHAARIVCTPDSVNMLSEACATDAPVYVFDPAIADGRIGAYLRALESRGRIRKANGALAPFDATPLRETARVAQQVRERLGF